MEVEECSVETRVVAIETITRAYRDTLDTEAPADIQLILDEAKEFLDDSDLAQLRRSLVAAWLGWRGGEHARTCGSD